jgi:hypothetical protein
MWAAGKCGPQPDNETLIEFMVMMLGMFGEGERVAQNVAFQYTICISTIFGG